MLARVYILCSPITAWFALGSWLRLSVLSLMAFSLFAVWQVIVQRRFRLHVDVAVLALFLLAIFLSSTINGNEFNHKSLNHLLAMIFIVIFMYAIPRVYLQHIVEDGGIDRLGLSFTYSFTLLASLVLLDFLAKNIFSVELADFFVFSDVVNGSYFSIASFYSVAGPTEEPANAAYYLSLMYMASILYYRYRGVTIPVRLTILYVCSLASTMSSVGIVVGCLILLLTYSAKGLAKKLMLFLALIIVLSLFSQSLLAVLGDVGFLDKLTLNAANASASIRMYSWELFIDSYLSSPVFGVAPGYNNILVESGVHSSIFTILVNYGFVSAMFLFAFIAYVYIVLKRKNGLASNFFLIALIPHFIGDYYFSSVFWLFVVWLMLIACKERLHCES